MTSLVVVGGTSGLGREVAKSYAERGHEVVLTGRDADQAAKVAEEIGGNTRGLGLELARPDEIGAALSGAALSAVARVDRLVLAAIDRDTNSAADYDISRALYLVTMKLVGYTEVIHQLLPRMPADASIVLFGGQAKERPYPGSTTVSTVNGGVVGLVHALVVELRPIRVNGIHPGIVGDSPFWSAKPPEVLEAVAARTPTGRTVRMSEVVGAVEFLLENPAVNGENLAVDGGWLRL